MPTLQEIVEKLSANESDEIDEFELIDMLRTEFGFAEDEAQDIRNALEDRGMLQLRGTGRIILANRHNPEAEYDALESAAEALDELPSRIGRRDPENPGASVSLATEGREEGLTGETGYQDLSGRTPPGARPEDERPEHLRDLSLSGELRDLDSEGEYVVADRSADYSLEDSARVTGSRFYDDETVVLGESRTFDDEEVAPRSTRSDDEPYEPSGPNEN